MKADALLEIVQRLFSLFKERQIDYVLVGGIALLSYVPGRNTKDIDLLMPPAALDKLPEITITGREKFFARGSYENLPIDILLTENPLFEKVFRDYSISRRFQEAEIPVATVEGLLLLKLYALPSLYRQGDFTRVSIYENDIAVLMHTFEPDMNRLFRELHAHLPATEMDSLREIVTEIEERIRRFRNHQT
ncbi:MAG: hypothetical protein D6681_10835 [Calditrichaeota bacterium]|nr:MAG: hypothetical protein D6681_10835 [Calditrichota bacterium]